jgi:hypothetical protein
MTSGTQFKTVSVACLLLGGRALAADAPPTADVLGKLHRSNLKEIEMGKMFGKMLADDHTAADKHQRAPEKLIDQGGKS